MKNIFSNQYYQKIKNNLQDEYNSCIIDLTEDLAEGHAATLISQDFIRELEYILSLKETSIYSPLNFYWHSLLDNLIYLEQMHMEFEEGQELIEEDIFDFWSDGHQGEMFKALLEDENQSIIDASKNLSPLLEGQIISFHRLHIEKDPRPFINPISYTRISEIGDSPEQFYITNSNKIAETDLSFDNFPHLVLSQLTSERSVVEIELEENYHQTPIKENKNSITLENKKLLFINPSCKKGIDSITSIKSKIEDALLVIKNLSPETYQSFSYFTHTIIPIDQNGIVSYSLQSLPGFSSINLFERDFVDLLDDLIHENGHHFLNYILNVEELIIEDDEKIFYSPWRNSPRPIRGIYHAYMTFFWALKLFFDLNKNLDKAKHHFSEEEKEKIKIRFIEEYIMLTYSGKDIEKAYKQKKITIAGLNLFKEFKEEIKKMELYSLEVRNKLSAESLKYIEDLEKNLQKGLKEHSLEK